MAFFHNSFEGTTNAVALTQGSGGNTGGSSGDYFPTITTSGTVTLEGSTAQAAHGTKSMHINGSNPSTGYVRYTSLGTASIGGYIYYRWNGSLPAVTGDFFAARNASTGSFSIGVSSGNLIQVKNAAGTTLNSGGWTVPSHSGTQWYRIEFECTPNASATTGVLTVRLYALDSATILTGMTYTASNVDMGSANIDHIRVGKITSAIALEMYIDDIALNTGTTTIPSLPGANVAPVASWTTTNPLDTPAGTVHVQGQVADSDGNMNSADVTMAYVSGPNSPLTPSVSASGSGTSTVTAQADLPLTAAGTHVIRLTGIDAAVAVSNNADLTIYATPAANVWTSPVAATLGQAVTFGSPTSTLSAVSDASNTTGHLSDDLVGVAKVMGPYTSVPLDTGPASVQTTGSKDVTGADVGVTIKSYLPDGTTLIDTSPQQVFSSTSPTTTTYQLGASAQTALTGTPKRGFKYTYTVINL